MDEVIESLGCRIGIVTLTIVAGVCTVSAANPCGFIGNVIASYSIAAAALYGYKPPSAITRSVRIDVCDDSDMRGIIPGIIM